MYYLCSENKGAEQLHGYHAADLRLCFSHMQKVAFPMMQLILSWQLTTKVLIRLPLFLIYMHKCLAVIELFFFFFF